MWPHGTLHTRYGTASASHILWSHMIKFCNPSKIVKGVYWPGFLIWFPALSAWKLWSLWPFLTFTKSPMISICNECLICYCVCHTMRRLTEWEIIWSSVQCRQWRQSWHYDNSRFLYNTTWKQKTRQGLGTIKIMEKIRRALENGNDLELCEMKLFLGD